MIIKDNFLGEFASFRHYCDHLAYAGKYNPVDGIFYPGIDFDIPPIIQAEVKHKIECLVSHSIKTNFMFLRLSLAGMEQPHQVHTDASMGQKTCILYLSRPEYVQGGTTLVRHHTGFEGDPLTPAQVALWEQDQADAEKWEIVDSCPMVSNRAVIFDSHLLHRAEPIGGFGDNAENGRLALSVFFNENPTRH